VYSANRVVQRTIDAAGPALTRERRVSVARLFTIGCAAAILAVLAGVAIEQSLDKWLVHSARLHHNQSY